MRQNKNRIMPQCCHKKKTICVESPICALKALKTAYLAHYFLIFMILRDIVLMTLKDTIQ